MSRTMNETTTTNDGPNATMMLCGRTVRFSLPGYIQQLNKGIWESADELIAAKNLNDDEAAVVRIMADPTRGPGTIADELATAARELLDNPPTGFLTAHAKHEAARDKLEAVLRSIGR